MTWTMTWRLLLISIATFVVGSLLTFRGEEQVGRWFGLLTLAIWVVVVVWWAAIWVSS